jgi:hypothetical protein
MVFGVHASWSLQGSIKLHNSRHAQLTTKIMQNILAAHCWHGLSHPSFQHKPVDNRCVLGILRVMGCCESCVCRYAGTRPHTN